MFGTILYDDFGPADVRDIRDALDGLCSPTRPYGWASTGVYTFCDPHLVSDTPIGSNVLYVGLATDLTQRFETHVGLRRGGQRSGSKASQLEAWFGSHDTIRMSWWVQSAFAQVDTNRTRAAQRRAGQRRIGEQRADYDDEGLSAARLSEGQLIESYRGDHGSLPPWNAVGGAIGGQTRAAGGSGRALLAYLEGRVDGMFRARLTLRELWVDDEPSADWESGPLHLARSEALMSHPAAGADDAHVVRTLLRLAGHRYFDMFGEIAIAVEQMRATGYLDDVPDIAGTDWYADT